jgi:flagellar motor protein MotB
MLMVSGFTDDRPVRDSNRQFADNWELSAQRALTVTRALIEEGVPSSSVFAAAFGARAAGGLQRRRATAAREPPRRDGAGAQWITLSISVC